MRIIARMAFDSNGIKFLLYASKIGADFRLTATLGRQYNYAPAEAIHKLFTTAGILTFEAGAIQAALDRHEGYSEGLFQLFGAESVESFDASDFEDAMHIHDLNYPIADEFKNAYSVVLDGGTLEHVFNYPAALKNGMEMVNEGGHLLGITPVNNFSGHGFYQFSPELFFRTFCAENGYEMKDLIFMEDLPDAPWYRVADPARLGRRVTFENARPAYLLLIAKRVEIKPIFERFPQQSDYSAAWKSENGERDDDNAAPGFIERIPGAVSRRLKKLTRPDAIRYETGDLVRFDPFG